MSRVPYFTDPYYEELFFSVMGRYQKYSSEIPLYLARRVLFGEDIPIQPHLYMGEHFKLLADRLGGLYTPERFLWNNTVFPFFRPFLEAERKEKVKEAVFDNGFKVISCLGIRSDTYPGAGKLRYCPECVKSSLDIHAEAYFSCFHHLPGIDICPIHKCYLEEYPLYSHEYPQDGYLALDEKRVTFNSRPCLNQSEINLAKSALEVMEFTQPCNFEDLVEWLKIILKKKGYYRGKSLKLSQLYSDLEDFYSQEYLKEKNCDYNCQTRHNNWLSFLIDSSTTNIAPPYRVLLLINFLFDDFNDFIEESKNVKQEVVYNCLNPCCSHYNKPVDGNIYIKHEHGVDKAVVECSCHMIYSVRLDNHKIMIRQYGSAWYDRYIELKDLKLKQKEIAQSLNVSISTIETFQKKKDYDPEAITHRIEKDRKKLLELKDQFNITTRKQLSRISKRLYLFLFTYDRDFLDQILPASKKKSKRIYQPPDYSKRDEELKSQVLEVVENLKEKDPFSRCTKKAIMRELGISSINLKKLPLTSKLIEQLSETREEFSIRKGCLILDQMIEQNIPITRQNFFKKGVLDIYQPAVYEGIIRYLNQKYLKNS